MAATRLIPHVAKRPEGDGERSRKRTLRIIRIDVGCLIKKREMTRWKIRSTGEKSGNREGSLDQAEVHAQVIIERAVAHKATTQVGSQPLWIEAQRAVFYAPWLPLVAGQASVLECFRSAVEARAARHSVSLQRGCALIVDNHRTPHYRRSIAVRQPALAYALLDPAAEIAAVQPVLFVSGEEHVYRTLAAAGQVYPYAHCDPTSEAAI